MIFDIKKVSDEAEKELVEEKLKDAKRRIKEKLILLDRAKKVVANLERELEDLYVELSQG